VADKVKIAVKERELTGKKVKQLRREGQIPAVIYGKDKKPFALVVDAKEFEKLYRSAGGNTIVELDFEQSDGTKAKRNVLIHEVETDPVRGDIIHADFLEIKMNEKITAVVPLNFVGDSLAVIDLGGSLLTQKDEVEVECLPANLPHEIEVDIAALVDFEAVIHVSDIKAPADVVILDDPEETIVRVEAPRTDEEMEELETPVEAPELAEAEEGSAETTEAPQEEQVENE
jgi:large subunit ribosomal protein L25